jgi:hypothetical protein
VAVVLWVPAFVAEHGGRPSQRPPVRPGRYNHPQPRTTSRYPRDSGPTAHRRRYLASDANNDPVGGLPAVLDWHTELYHRKDLDTWATAGGHVSGLTATLAVDSRRHTEPQRPQLHRNTDPPGPRPAPQRPTAVLRLATGEPDALSPRRRARLPVDMIGAMAAPASWSPPTIASTAATSSVPAFWPEVGRHATLAD